MARMASTIERALRSSSSPLINVRWTPSVGQKSGDLRRVPPCFQCPARSEGMYEWLEAIYQKPNSGHRQQRILAGLEGHPAVGRGKPPRSARGQAAAAGRATQNDPVYPRAGSRRMGQHRRLPAHGERVNFARAGAGFNGGGGCLPRLSDHRGKSFSLFEYPRIFAHSSCCQALNNAKQSRRGAECGRMAHCVIQEVGRKEIALSYDPSTTSILPVDITRFLSEGGKLWPRVNTDKEEAEALRSRWWRQRSVPRPRSRSKPGRDAGWMPVHSFHTLPADRATMARNTISAAIDPQYPLTVVTRPTQVQQKTFAQLGLAL